MKLFEAEGGEGGGKGDRERNTLLRWGFGSFSSVFLYPNSSNDKKNLIIDGIRSLQCYGMRQGEKILGRCDCNLLQYEHRSDQKNHEEFGGSRSDFTTVTSYVCGNSTSPLSRKFQQ